MAESFGRRASPSPRLLALLAPSMVLLVVKQEANRPSILILSRCRYSAKKTSLLGLALRNRHHFEMETLRRGSIQASGTVVN